MVFCFQVSAILVLVIIQMHFSRGANEDCQEAVHNAEVVESCPTSKEEWEIGARRKNCSKLAAEAERKNCTMNEKQPEYHCLINGLRNKLLEVCVTAKIIFGHCAEFNEAGKVIQNHYTAPCEKISPKCDNSYRSSDAYKYPGCYRLVNKTQVLTNLESGGPEFKYKEKITIIIAVTVGICISVGVLWFIRRRNGERKIERDGTEHLGLMETATKQTINKGADLKPPIQYFVCKIRKFQHLYYFNNSIKEYKHRMEMRNKSNNLTDKVIEDGLVIIGVIGKFTDEDLLLFPKGEKIEEYGNKSPSEAVPVLCFQNNIPLQSALEACHIESACHLILVKPVQDVADKADDFMIVVDRNKEMILEAVTSCLEQPLCNMLQEWMHLYSEDSAILGEIEALYTTRLNASDTPKVPDNLKIYLSRRSDIEGYSMSTSSLLKVFVKKSTDKKELENDLKKLNPHFFTKCFLRIEKSKFLKKNTGRLVRKYDDDRKIDSSTLQNKMKLLIWKMAMFPVNGIYLLWTELKEQKVDNQKGVKEKVH